MPDSAAWSQATLPVKQGGLGIRSAVDIAPSAFLALSHASSELVSALLPSHLNSLPLPFIDEAAACWSQSHDSEPPVGTGAQLQAEIMGCPESICYSETSAGKINAKDDEDRTRLLATSTKESGA